MKLLTLIFVGLVTAEFAAAAPGAAGGSGWTGAAALSMGAGTMKDKDDSLPKTDLLYTEATFQGAYRFGSIAPLVQLGYRYVGQTTKADDVNGNNVGGSGYTVGAGLEGFFSSVRVAAVYDLLGQYDLSKTSSGGSKVSYSKPTGFHFMIGYNWKPSWEWFVGFSQLQFNEKISASQKTDIKDNPVIQTLYGVGISYLF